MLPRWLLEGKLQDDAFMSSYTPEVSKPVEFEEGREHWFLARTKVEVFPGDFYPELRPYTTIDRELLPGYKVQITEEASEDNIPLKNWLANHTPFSDLESKKLYYIVHEY